MIRKLGTCILGMLFLAVVASAQSPHFVSASAAVNSNGALVISWKEAGLGSYTSITYNGSADYSAVWGCLNGGGKHPKASNKTAVAGPLSSSGEFEASKSGQITGDLTLAPPAPPSTTLSCPGGQTLALISVEYSNVSVEDYTNNLTEPISGTFSVVFYK